MKLHILSLGGIYPLQGFGFVGEDTEHSFYFHANRGTWKMAIADSLEHAVTNMVHKQGWYWEGHDWREQTTMLHDANMAKRIIFQCANAYERGQQISHVHLKTKKAHDVLIKFLAQAHARKPFFVILDEVCKKLYRTKRTTEALQTDIHTLEQLGGQDERKTGKTIAATSA